MNNEWEYAGLLIEEFNISLKRIEECHLQKYPAKWLAQLEKKLPNKPGYTVYAWDDNPCNAVIKVYNKSHTSIPENVYKDMKVYLSKCSGKRQYALKEYRPGTKQHGRLFDDYYTRESAITAAKYFELELVESD